MRGVDEGKAQIGFANSSTTVDGLEGRAPYPKKVTKVCQVANLYPQYFQVVALADAKVNSLADLKGKSLVTQPKGNTAELLTDVVLKLNGMNYQSLAKVNFQAVVHRRGVADEGRPRAGVHARHHGAGLGGHGPRQRARRHAGAGRRQDHGRAEEGEPGLQQADHQGRAPIRSRTKDVPVIGYSTHIVAACDLPEDMVYKMTKTMAANVDAMAAVVKAIDGITPKDMALDIGVPFHKGAAKFYKEAGAL